MQLPNGIADVHDIVQHIKADCRTMTFSAALLDRALEQLIQVHSN